jgi:hypothetical protein
LIDSIRTCASNASRAHPGAVTADDVIAAISLRMNGEPRRKLWMA